jgi:D-tyrosyl-tRNA(Tyr) deacylase
VTVDGRTTGAIDGGLVVLAGFAPGDTETELAWMARKLPRLRIFRDEADLMNLGLAEVGGAILLVSQFTLYGDCRKGQRPSFVASAPPAQARRLYDRFAELLRAEWPAVQEGVFGAMMEVTLTNDGPVTLILEREAAGAGGAA